MWFDTLVQDETERAEKTTPPHAVAVGDFNRGGIPDLAVANYGSRNVSVLLGGV
jgi:hypothetical protein